MGLCGPSRKHARHQHEWNVYRSRRALWVGAGFTARLTLERTVSLNCFVKRIEPGKGMGVSVAVSEPESQKLYENLLSSLSTTGA